MKKLSIVLLIFVCFQAFSQKTQILEKPQVDPRVELLSIVFRLAQKPEYSDLKYKFYTDKIETHFGKFKDHALIQFVQSNMYKDGLGYDAVMLMAIHLDNKLNPLKNITGNSLDGRWNQNAKQFITLLKKFNKDTQFEKFYQKNADLYSTVGERFLPVYEQLDLDWYTRFYGSTTTGAFKIINAPGNGGNNYGPSVKFKNGEKDVYAILGIWQVDGTGMPIFNSNEYLPILLHEFNHSFVNHLTETNKEIFKNSGEKLFAILNDEMKSQAYDTWEIMLNEALVRASVIKYMIDHKFDQQVIKNEINNQLGKGFLWIKGLVAELNKYDSQRSQYSTLDDYMPILAKEYENYAQTIQAFDNKRPQITSITEFTNGDANVKATLQTITINFDKPLSGKGYSVFYGSKGEKAFPKVEKISYSNNNTSVIMEVKLEKNKEYQFVMNGQKFITNEGIGIKNYEVNFKTGE